VCLDLSAGYLYRERSEQYFDKREYTTLILGVGATFTLAENMNITAGFDYGLYPDADIDSLIDYQVDFNYYITKQIGLSLGYRSSCWDYKDDDGDKDTISGITTRVTYKF
jgi:hypothetical protein